MSQLNERLGAAPGRITLSLWLIVLITAGGCHSAPAPSTPSSSATEHPYQWPAKLEDFRFRWSAEPGFELTSGWAVPLRAYLESRLVVEYTDDVKTAYEGYEMATPAPIPPGSAELLTTPYARREIRAPRGPSRFDDPGQRIVGTEALDVLQAEPIPSGFRAIVCDATFDTYKRAGNESKYVPLNSYSGFQPTDVESMKVWRIEFSNRDSRPGAPPSPDAPQSGPLPAPTNDVFGSWFVTGALDVGGWSDSDHPNLVQGSPEQRQRLREAQDAETAMRERCLDRYPLDASQRAARSQTALPDPPPVDPPIPGWPAEGK